MNREMPIDFEYKTTDMEGNSIVVLVECRVLEEKDPYGTGDSPTCYSVVFKAFTNNLTGEAYTIDDLDVNSNDLPDLAISHFKEY